MPLLATILREGRHLLIVMAFACLPNGPIAWFRLGVAGVW